MATVAVLGAGGVGGMLAVRLAVSELHRVVCVARPGTARAIGAGGITLEAPDGTFRARPIATESLEERVDLLVIAVKAYDLDAALRRVAPEAVAEGVSLALLNGLEHMETIRARLGDAVAAGAVGRLEAYRRAPTIVVQSLPPVPLVTVSTAGLAPPASASVVSVLESAGIEVRTLPTDAEVLWEKAARLAPLAAVTAATGRPLGELLAAPDDRALLEAAVEDACAVAAAAGVAVTFSAQWAMIEGMPPGLTTSAARDRAAGRPSEIDAVVGAVVRSGRRLGVPTPTLDRLLVALEAA